MYKNIYAPISILLLVASFSSFAHAATSGEVTFTSNYVWRGQTQSSNLPAIQGGFDFQPIENLGLIIGVWGSSVQFDTKNACRAANQNTNITCVDSETASVELDGFAGLRFSLGDYEDLSLSVLLQQYSYPGAVNLPSWQEASAGIVLGGLEFSIAVSDDYLGTGAATTFGEASLAIGFAIFDIILGVSYTEANMPIFADETGYATFELTYAIDLGSLEFQSGIFTSTIEDDSPDGFCAFDRCGQQAFLSLTKNF